MDLNETKGMLFNRVAGDAYLLLATRLAAEQAQQRRIQERLRGILNHPAKHPPAYIADCQRDLRRSAARLRGIEYALRLLNEAQIVTRYRDKAWLAPNLEDTHLSYWGESPLHVCELNAAQKPETLCGYVLPPTAPSVGLVAPSTEALCGECLDALATDKAVPEAVRAAGLYYVWRHVITD